MQYILIYILALPFILVFNKTQEYFQQPLIAKLEVEVGPTVRHWQGENAMKTCMQNGIYCIIRICLIGNKPHLTQPPRQSMRFSNTEKQFSYFQLSICFRFGRFIRGASLHIFLVR